MSKQRYRYEPDWVDVNTQLTAIGEDFGCICEFSVTVERDRVTVIARCRRIVDLDDPTPMVQALASRPFNTKPDVAIMCFGAAHDCYRQLDSGILGKRSGEITYGWNGRPHIARRSTE
jgi:hypothetical protein